MIYINRNIESIVQRVVQNFPSIVITGPRQSGKTTLLRQLFEKTHQFVTFDDPLTRERALSDPLLFLETLAPKVILDEIQYVPQLLSYLKIAIDEQRDINGRFLLSGSQQFHLMKNLGDSLAGRIAILNLLPFAVSELKRSAVLKKILKTPKDFFVFSVLRGSFPEIALNPEKDSDLWYSSFLQTYLERDIRQLANIGDLNNFQRFIRLLAARCGQILNLSSFASDLGVSVNTIKNWLSILQASQIIYLLQPYYRNLNKRITKSPKIYFLDVGLVAYLTGIRTENLLMNGPLAGPLFENFIIQEIIKIFYNKGKQPNLYYLRTHNQLEIDLIIEKQFDEILPVEIKLAKTLSLSMAKPIERFIDWMSKTKIQQGQIISLADESFPLSSKVKAMPFKSFLEELENSI